MAKKCWLLGLMLITSLLIFAQDSTNHPVGSGTSDVAGGEPAFLLFMIIILVGLFTAVIFGITIISIGAVALIALLTAGVISFSVFMGVYQKSLRSGIKTLVITGFSVLGGGAGLIGYFIFILMRQANFSVHYPLLLSMFGGVLGGMIGGWTALNVLERLYVRYKPKGV